MYKDFLNVTGNDCSLLLPRQSCSVISPQTTADFSFLFRQRLLFFLLPQLLFFLLPRQRLFMISSQTAATFYSSPNNVSLLISHQARSVIVDWFYISFRAMAVSHFSFEISVYQITVMFYLISHKDSLRILPRQPMFFYFSREIAVFFSQTTADFDLSSGNGFF